jgi:hypothetical protein
MLDALFWVSISGVLGVVAYRAVFRREVRLLLVSLGTLGIIVPVLVADRVVFPPWLTNPLARGEDHQGAIVFLLYLAMLAGMLAHFGYGYLALPKRSRRRFDVANFLAPILVSPIVFLPLASLFGSSPTTTVTRSSHVMLLLIAFENGFFWREFFENRQKVMAARGDK